MKMVGHYALERTATSLDGKKRAPKNNVAPKSRKGNFGNTIELGYCPMKN